MDQVKITGRDVATETKKRIRDLDGHDLGDDVANIKDEIGKDAGNLGDRLHEKGHEIADELDHEAHEEQPRLP